MTDLPPLEPMDAGNQALLANVHPPDWVNPAPAGRYNLVVIGGGTAGLVTAAGAAALGAKVALIEKHFLGGDCLNVGCVPSKAMIRSAEAAAAVREAAGFGVSAGVPNVDFAAVMQRVRTVRSGISLHDSVRRFSEMGIDVFLGAGTFTAERTAVVGGATLNFAAAVIATGARAAVPDIEGLAEAGYLTNETVFNLTQLPQRLAVLGGGPIGCELAQAFRRLGGDVTIITHGPNILSREDADVSSLLAERFRAEGIEVVTDSTVTRVTVEFGCKLLQLSGGDPGRTVTADAILVAVGRQVNVDGLGLEAAGVEYDGRAGVVVDDRLRTTNRHIYAAGDVCMAHKFTHAADAAARIVIANALFMGRRKLSELTIPRCTYTDPAIAHVGLSEREATKEGIAITTFVRPLAEVDRAITDGESCGMVKVHVAEGTDTILGATIIARHAGDMIGELVLAMKAGIGLRTIADVIHPYPTRAEAVKQTGDVCNRTRLTPRVRKLMAKWLAWRRGTS